MPRFFVSGEYRGFMKQKELQNILSTEIQRVAGGREVEPRFPRH